MTASAQATVWSERLLADLGQESFAKVIGHSPQDNKPLSPQDQKKIRIQKKDESLLDSDFQIQTYIAHAPPDPAEEGDERE